MIAPSNILQSLTKLATTNVASSRVTISVAAYVQPLLVLAFYCKPLSVTSLYRTQTTVTIFHSFNGAGEPCDPHQCILF